MSLLRTTLSAAAAPGDLSVCDLEPIRWPGAIQPHGHMLVLRADSLEPLARSAQCTAEQARAVLAALPPQALRELGEPGQRPMALGRVQVEGAAEFDVTAHRTAAHVIVECEPPLPQPPGPPPLVALTQRFLPRLQQTEDVERLCQLAAQEVARLTGFGRALVYRFDEDGHGQVLAEVLEPGYDSYLHHHFPAQDIPQQARALYLANHFRLIPDARYHAVPLLAMDPGTPVDSIDMSMAWLRSVSPVHLEYMRNMGTLASMSVSIVVNGKLWGLVSCHDHAPRRLGPQVRMACEHLGQLLSLRIGASLVRDDAAKRLMLREHILSMVAHLAESDASLRRLTAHPGLLRLGAATGAAVVLDDEVWTCGSTPSDEQVLELARWIAQRGDEIYATESLERDYADGAQLRDVAAGVLAASISQVHRHVILWFRPERVRTVRWAGNPRKTVDEGGRIQPRRSFASWVEHVGGHSARWRPAELGAVRELREALIGIVLRRAQEMAEAATALARVNKELEAFSYTVSHDLRAPMRHIAGYADLVVDLEGDKLGERSRRYLGHVKEAAAFAGHLVDALLDFSRMGRAALKRRQVATGTMVADLVRELTRLEPGRQLHWEIASELPRLYADPFLLQVATRNLLANAVKYTRDRPDARIVVRGICGPRGDGLEVEDNGVGFEMQYAGKLFGVFQRLHPSEEFEGTGIGLANVKRIVERHGGEVWARGEPQRGAVFGFTLPRPQAAA